jgi:hypothetical protein
MSKHLVNLERVDGGGREQGAIEEMSLLEQRGLFACIMETRNFSTRVHKLGH